jgi:hypothetical protein
MEVTGNANIVPARLKGRTTGALICGFFGAVWMFEALYFGSIATPAWLAVIAILAGIFIIGPIARLRSLSHLPASPAGPSLWPTVRVQYWSLVAIEWTLCAIASFQLAHMHRPDLIPQVLGVIIGLHFLPLGKIFRMPLYFATGAAVVLGVLATLAISPGDTRNIAACGILGLSLWTTAAIILWQDGPAPKEKTAAFAN